MRAAELALRKYGEIVKKAQAEQARLKVGGASLSSIGLMAKRLQSSRKKNIGDWRRKSLPEPTEIADSHSENNYLQIRPMFGTGQSESHTQSDKFAFMMSSNKRPSTQMGTANKKGAAIKSTAERINNADRSGLKTSQLGRLGLGADARRRITVSLKKREESLVQGASMEDGAWQASEEHMQDRYFDRDHADSSVSVMQPARNISSGIPTHAQLSKQVSRTIEVGTQPAIIQPNKLSDVEKKKQAMAALRLKQMGTLKAANDSTDPAAAEAGLA